MRLAAIAAEDVNGPIERGPKLRAGRAEKMLARQIFQGDPLATIEGAVAGKVHRQGELGQQLARAAVGQEARFAKDDSRIGLAGENRGVDGNRPIWKKQGMGNSG